MSDVIPDESQPPPECETSSCPNVATCRGVYDGLVRAACDECCGHGREGGYCNPLGSIAWPVTQAATGAACTLAQLLLDAVSDGAFEAGDPGTMAANVLELCQAVLSNPTSTVEHHLVRVGSQFGPGDDSGTISVLVYGDEDALTPYRHQLAELHPVGTAERLASAERRHFIDWTKAELARTEPNMAIMQLALMRKSRLSQVASLSADQIAELGQINRYLDRHPRDLDLSSHLARVPADIPPVGRMPSAPRPLINTSPVKPALALDRRQIAAPSRGLADTVSHPPVGFPRSSDK